MCEDTGTMIIVVGIGAARPREIINNTELFIIKNDVALPITGKLETVRLSEEVRIVLDCIEKQMPKELIASIENVDLMPLSYLYGTYRVGTYRENRLDARICINRLEHKGKHICYATQGRPPPQKMVIILCR